MNLLGLVDKIIDDGDVIEVACGVAFSRILMVNICFINHPEQAANGWVLIDAGMPHSAQSIIKTAESRFGKGGRPVAIVLTHGHFDHIGAIIDLVNYWGCPVYAHPLEMPYLTGEANYPPPEPTADDGLMAKISPLYPHNGINLGGYINVLPQDGTVPGLTGWRWIHTPGHTPGHVSFFRDKDKVLVAGDAFVTVKQESAVAVLIQEEEIHGPPAYFTTDWQSAWNSVKLLNSLEPSVVVTGHGVPMHGEKLREELKILAHDFWELAIPHEIH